MKLLCSLFLLLLVVGSHAQTSSQGLSQSDSISYRKPFLAIYPAIIRNGDKLTNEQATVLFHKVPEAAALYQQYRRRYQKGIYSYAGFFVGTVAGALGFDNSNKSM